MKRISAILLAGGQSSRMGKVNKLTINVGGVALLRRSACILLASKLQEIVVVLGYEYDKNLPLLQGLAVKIVVNNIYKQGQMTSVNKGLEALSKPCCGVMICLADQPLLETIDINTLIDAFGQCGQNSILVPTYLGKRGNPIIIANKHKEAILKDKVNLGCKHFINNNPQMVTTIEMDNNNVIFDLDTPEDCAILEKAS